MIDKNYTELKFSIENNREKVLDVLDNRFYSPGTEPVKGHSN